MQPLPKSGFRSCREAAHLCSHMKYGFQMQRFCPLTCNTCVQFSGAKEMSNPLREVPHNEDLEEDPHGCVDDDAAVARLTDKGIIPNKPVMMPWFKNWTLSQCQACCTCKAFYPDNWNTCKFMPCKYNSPYHCWDNIIPGPDKQMDGQVTYDQGFLQGMMMASDCVKLPGNQFPNCEAGCEFRPPRDFMRPVQESPVKVTENCSEPGGEQGWESKVEPHPELEGVTSYMPIHSEPPKFGIPTSQLAQLSKKEVVSGAITAEQREGLSKLASSTNRAAQ